jgi:hypothetical protein
MTCTNEMGEYKKKIADARRDAMHVGSDDTTNGGMVKWQSRGWWNGNPSLVARLSGWVVLVCGRGRRKEVVRSCDLYSGLFALYCWLCTGKITIIMVSCTVVSCSLL